MAKIDGNISRNSALAEDEPLDRFYRPADAAPGLRPLRPLPVEDDEEREPAESFLRSGRRVPVRRGLLPKNRIARIAFLFGIALAIGLVILLGIAVRDFLEQDTRFRVDSASSIQVLGNSEVTRPELLSVFGSDIGRNVFFIPLAERRTDLERLPWVEHATVMRLLPDQLRVSIIERTPIAFVRHGKEIGLVDRNGVVLDMPTSIMAERHFSFPVVTGIEASDSLSIRAARMKIYQRFVADLDADGNATGEKISEQLSEVDLTDPEDVRALMPEQGSDILVHFGEDKFLSRYKNYKTHLAEWRQQYPNLAAVDLRYEHQVVLQMDKAAASQEKATATATAAIDTATNQTPAAAVPPLTRRLAAARPAAPSHRSRRRTATPAGPRSAGYR